MQSWADEQGGRTKGQHGEGPGQRMAAPWPAWSGGWRQGAGGGAARESPGPGDQDEVAGVGDGGVRGLAAPSEAVVREWDRGVQLELSTGDQARVWAAGGE